MFLKLKKLIGWLPIGLMHAGFCGTGIALQRLFAGVFPSPVPKRTLVYLEAVRHLRRSFKSQVNSDYPVFVINRDRDAGRLARFQKTCRRFGIQFERLRAVDLGDPNEMLREFESQIGDTFNGKSQFLRGAVGCFLSHAKAWRAVLDGGYEAGFVCEDDARFLAPLPSTWKTFPIPDNCDLMFANQRMAVGLQQRDYLRQLSAKRLLSIPAYDAIVALQRVIQQISGPGGDGYLVTKRGAARLLDILKKNRITMELDWFLFFYSMTAEERGEFIRQENSGRFDRLEFSDDPIRSYVLFPFWVEQSTETSTIDFMNPMNYVERSQLLSRSEREPAVTPGPGGASND
jgi:GR25 family glycosyltransferase involved in LPS biosynthesis